MTQGKDGAARAAALRLLARREHSEQELSSKLQSRGFIAADIDMTLKALAGEGMLSNERFTEEFVRAATAKGQGPLRIQHRLRERGISDDLIAKYLDANAPCWHAHACQVRRRRFGHAVPLGWQGQAKQARFLQYRGFSGEQIRAALKTGEGEFSSEVS